jgi:hypothetical protein
MRTKLSSMVSDQTAGIEQQQELTTFTSATPAYRLDQGTGLRAPLVHAIASDAERSASASSSRKRAERSEGEAVRDPFRDIEAERKQHRMWIDPSPPSRQPLDCARLGENPAASSSTPFAAAAIIRPSFFRREHLS